MRHYTGAIAGQPYDIRFCETEDDARLAFEWAIDNPERMSLDTEATTWDVYDKSWRLRLFQFGTKTRVYVIPVDSFPWAVQLVCQQPRQWVAHNAAHDVRQLDHWSARAFGEWMHPHWLEWFTDTYLMAHVLDNRTQEEGGIGHGLKALSVAHVDPLADDGEQALKAAIKQIDIPIPDKVYESGPRKGQQRMRKANLDEGWALFPINHDDYIRYAGLDVVLNMHLLEYLEPLVAELEHAAEIISEEHELQVVCEYAMHRKGIKIDVPYFESLSAEYAELIEVGKASIQEMGLDNYNSPPQVSVAMIKLGAELTKKTENGNLSVDREVLTDLTIDGGPAGELAAAIIWTKKMEKARSAWIENSLARRDENDRVHAGINTLTAVTARMSVDSPPLQQLPSGDPTVRDGFLADD